jgi:hypothetical protein
VGRASRNRTEPAEWETAISNSEIEDECRIDCTGCHSHCHCHCHCTCLRTPLTAVMATLSAGGQKGALSSVATAMRREKSFSSTVTVVTRRRKRGEQMEGRGREREDRKGNQSVEIMRGVSSRIFYNRQQGLRKDQWLAAAIATFTVISSISLFLESHTSLALLLLGALCGSQ